MKLNINSHDIPFGTDILSITVPPALRQRHQTGLHYVDGVMGGRGFTPSTVTIFTGEPGAGKTTMALSLCNGLTGQGHIAVFNTAEESLHQISLTTERLGLKHGFLTGNTDCLDDLIEGLREIQSANPKKQLFFIVDSLQCMHYMHPKFGRYHSATGALEMITNFCKETNAIAIIINQVNKSGKMAGSNKLKHMVDCHLHLSIEQRDPDLLGCRVLTAEKNRFGGCGHLVFLDMAEEGFKLVGTFKK